MVGPVGQIKTIRRFRIADQVVQQISQAILSGSMAPGERLPPERDLALRFEVTRTSVRDGLKKLEGFGMITIKPGEGAFVRDVHREATLSALEPILLAAAEGQADMMRGVQEFRVLLQCEVARCAAERRTEDEARVIEGLAARMSQTTDPRALQRLDWDLCQAYIAAAHNVIFALVMNTVRPLHERWAPVYFALPGVADRTARYHRLLALAIRRRDAAKAVRITRLLLDYSDPLLFENVRSLFLEASS